MSSSGPGGVAAITPIIAVNLRASVCQIHPRLIPSLVDGPSAAAWLQSPGLAIRSCRRP
jgi:hypothetical protein